MKTSNAVLIAIAAAFSGAAQAQTAAPGAPAAPQYYVGVGAARPTGDGTVSPKLFGGVELNNNVGVEAGYTDFGSHDRHYDYGGTIFDSNDKGHAAYLVGKYTVPLGERFATYAKAGLSYTNWEYKSQINGVPDYRYKYSDTGLYAALGAQYKLSEKVALNAEFEHHGRSLNAWSLGVKVGF